MSCLKLTLKINDLTKENEELKSHCSTLENEQKTLKDKEVYLNEQLKIYEQNQGSEETNSGEIKRLHAQLELEMKYMNLQFIIPKCIHYNIAVIYDKKTHYLFIYQLLLGRQIEGINWATKRKLSLPW